MSAPNGGPDPYAMVISDLRAKRAQIDQTIKLLEGLRGDGGGAPVGAPVEATPAQAEPIGPGNYLGMSIVDAAKKALASRRQALGNAEIHAMLKAGGLHMNSVDPLNTIGSVLTRRFNQVGDIVKVGRGVWGLKEWYPNRTFKTPTKTPNAGQPEQPEQPEQSPTSEPTEPEQPFSPGGDVDLA